MTNRSSRHTVAPPVQQPPGWLRRNWITVGGVAVIGACIVFTLTLMHADRVEMPRFSQDELAALADDEATDRRLVVHLCSWLYRGDDLASWRTLSPTGQHLWTTLVVEDVIARGDQVPLSESAKDEPTLKDAAEGYRAFGQEELAVLADAGNIKQILRDKGRLLGAAHHARLEFVRQHTAEVARPVK